MVDCEIPGTQVNLDASRSLEIVAVASEAQAAKLREVMNRLDQIAKLDSNALRNLTEVLTASKADGGCGIGCW